MRYILKKTILFTTLLLGSLSVTSAFADEVNLKKSCVKDNPIIAGETDPSLLNIYAQACDKKNKDTKNVYLVQAAQRFQQLGKNLKALQLVDQLNGQQFQHSALTDVKFLAGVSIANQALTQLRDKEVRYLSEEGYAPAMALADAVKRAKPLAVIEAPVEVKAAPYKAPYKPPVKSTYKPPARSTNRTPAPVKVQPKVVPKTAAPTSSPTTKPSTGRVSPFGGM